jgi:hypothetical protein
MRAMLVAMLAACGQAGSVYVFDETTPVASFDTDQYELNVVAAGDVDGDGHPDFFVQSDMATDLYFGIDHAPVTLDVASGVVPLGDIDGDGRADFVAGLPSENSWSGSATFYAGNAQPSDSTGIPVPGEVVAVAAVDMDGDHVADLVVATDASAGQPTLQCGIDVYRGGAGFDLTAAPETSLLVTALGTPVVSLQSGGDVDGDGREDLVVQGDCMSEGELEVYFGGAALDGPPSRTIAVGQFPVVARDFDGDGFSDLAVTEYVDAGTDVLVYFGPGLEMARLRIPGKLADAGDVDGDGYADLIVITPTGDLAVYRGGPAMDDVPDFTIPQPDGRPFGSAAYLGSGQLVAAYPGWRSG